MIEKATSKESARAIERCEEEEKCKQILTISKDESWKIPFIANSQFEEFLDSAIKMKDEDKAMILSNTKELWKLKLMEGCIGQDTWKLDMLSSCNYQWKGEMVANCKTEYKANIILFAFDLVKNF